MGSAEHSLFAFERLVDHELESSHVWSMPLRSILSALFLTVDGLISQDDVERGGFLVSQISLLSGFFPKCSLEIGSSAENALSVIGLQEREVLRQLIVYARFCELMPGVRRGHYSVEALDDSFHLDYSEAARSAEEYDFILHEVAKATDTASLETRSPSFSQLVRDWPTWDVKFIQAVLRQLYDHHLRNVYEGPLLRSEAYEVAFGFTRNDFAGVRAALFALSSFSNGLHIAAAEERDRSEKLEKKAKYDGEFLEWNTPVLTKWFVYSCINQLTGLRDSKIDVVLAPFVMNASSGDFYNAGDGYLPPLVLLGDSILFNPHAVRMMMHERNLLYVVNKRQREHFDNIVSHHMEPVLIDEAFTEFSRVPNWLVRRNVRWSKGEVDLLAFDPQSNTALQIQAKAAIPAQNARMTRQLEEHTLRAISQIDTLKELSSEELDDFLSRTFHRRITNAALISAALSRSGFGTWRSWSALRDVVALNIPLLGETLRLISIETGSPLSEFPRVAVESLNNWTRRVVRRWGRSTIELLGKSVHFPVIELNERGLSSLKIELGLVGR
jgi:hypothetical protein